MAKVKKAGGAKRVRTATKPTVTRRELARLRREAKAAHVNAVANVPHIMRDRAQALLRRDLAAWVMAFRTRFDALLDEVSKIRRANFTEGHILYGLLDENRLSHIWAEMEGVNGHLPMLTVPCEVPNVLATAENVQRNWLDEPAEAQA